MAVAGSLLTADANSTPAATYDTASISPGGNRLQLFSVFGVDAALTTPPTFSLSGNSLTWVSVLRLANGVSALQVFRAMGASPSAGAVTISSDLVALLFGHWVASEYTGIDTSGSNGSGAVGNTAQNTGADVDTITVTLAAFGSGNNGTYGTFAGTDFASGSAFSFTPSSGFTELAEAIISGGAIATGLQAQWKATNDTSVDATTSRAMDDLIGIAIEIVAAAAGATRPPSLLLLGVG